MGFWGKLGMGASALGGGALMFVPGGQLAGAGLLGVSAGLGKHELSDIPKEQAATRLAGETERYSPWTGLHGKLPEKSSAIGSGMQGGVTGLMLGQGLSSAGLLSSAAAPASVAGGATSAGPNLGVKGVEYAASAPSAASLQTPGFGYDQPFQGFGNFGDTGIPLIPDAGSNAMNNPGGWSQLLKQKYATLGG